MVLGFVDHILDSIVAPAAAAAVDAVPVVVVAVVDTVVQLAVQSPVVLVAGIPGLIADNSDSVDSAVVDTVDFVAADLDNRAAVAVACAVPGSAYHLARYYQRLDCPPRLPSPSPENEMYHVLPITKFDFSNIYSERKMFFHAHYNFLHKHLFFFFMSLTIFY